MTNLLRVEVYESAGGVLDSNGHIMLSGTTVSRANVLEVPGREINRTDTPDKIYRVHRSKEALEAAFDSFAAAPVYLGHKQGGEPDGFPVGRPAWVNDSTVGLGIKLTSQAAVGAYQRGEAREISPQYRYQLTPAPDGAGHDYETLGMVIDHLAVVPKGKNGPGVRLREEDVSDLQISEEAATKIGEAAGEAAAKASGGVLEKVLKSLGLKRAEEAPEGDGDGKNKPEATATRTEEEIREEIRKEMEAEQKKAVEAATALVADKGMVEPLLATEAAKTLVKDADNSVQVFGVALGMKEEDAKAKGADVLRGIAEERIRTKEQVAERKEEQVTWENANTPNVDGSQQRSEAKISSFRAARNRRRGMKDKDAA